MRGAHHSFPFMIFLVFLELRGRQIASSSRCRLTPACHQDSAIAQIPLTMVPREFFKRSSPM